MTQDTREALAAEVKRLAEDMADAACATEAGAFVDRQRKPLHEAIDRLAALSSQPPAPSPMLCAQDMADLERLSDLFNDGMPYDLEKPSMRRLAKLGAIRHVSAGYYAITAFGRHCIDPEWGLPLRTVEQINADLDAAERASLTATAGSTP